MTTTFASIELARLYESQGYIEDALSIYKELEKEGGDEEAGAAVKRLTLALAQGDRSDPKADLARAVAGVTQGPEDRIAGLLEKWLMLMVVQKRVKMFKAIKARLN